jgi:F0F1-type ATP synthase assembly protein I
MAFDSKLMRLSSALSGAAINLGLLTYGGYWLGNKIDIKLHTAPLFLIGGLFVGSIAGIAAILLIVNRLK